MKVWSRRWTTLHDAGLEPPQLWAVYDILEECRAFGSQTTARSAAEQLSQLCEGWRDDLYVDPEDLEGARRHWAKVAVSNGWYSAPFFVQVWVDDLGAVMDSVSYRGLDRDVVTYYLHDES